METVHTPWGYIPVPGVSAPASARWSLGLLEALRPPCWGTKTWTLTLATQERGTWREGAGWTPVDFPNAFEGDGRLVVEFGLGDSDSEAESDDAAGVRIEEWNPFDGSVNPFGN